MDMADEQWKMKDGKMINVGDMTEGHAKNCLRLMLRWLRDRKEDDDSREDLVGIGFGACEFWND